MRRVVGEEMGVKAAGGVRDLEGLKAMVAAGATRIGASAGVRIVQESRGQQPTAMGKGYQWTVRAISRGVDTSGSRIACRAQRGRRAASESIAEIAEGQRSPRRPGI